MRKVKRFYLRKQHFKKNYGRLQVELPGNGTGKAAGNLR